MAVSSNEIEHDMNNQKIINLAAPTGNNDATRKIYVDNSIDTDVTTHSNSTTGVHGVTGNVVGTEDNVNVLADITSTGANIEDAVSKRHTQNTDTALGSGCVAADHGAAATDQVINICYGTGEPPDADTTTEGTLFVKYVA